MSILSTIGGWLFGNSGGSVVEKSLDLADQYIEDKDKRTALAVDLIKSHNQAGNVATVPWVDALHKMGRQLLMFTLIAMYWYSWKTGTPIPTEDLALLAAGPGVYTLLKGRGNS